MSGLPKTANRRTLVSGGGGDPSSSFIVVPHGDNETVERPTAGAVYWIGSVLPTNSIDGDLWFNSQTGQLTPIYIVIS
jgi:hypothetical protein